MKRFLILAITACMVLSAAAANAKEMVFQGQFEHSLQWIDNGNLFKMGDNGDGDGQSEDDFNASQRIRLYFNYVGSENVRGVVGFEMDQNWGEPGGGQLGTDGMNVEIKHAYTDFNISGLSMRVGLQPLGFPSAVAGSPIWDNDVAGVVASYQFNDMFALTAGWARLANINATNDDDDGTSNSYNDEIDAFTLIAPITGDGWSVTPYAIYAAIGKDAYAATTSTRSLLSSNATGAYTDDVTGFWGGAAVKVEAFDPIVLMADVIYGSVSGDDEEQNDRSGWFAAFEADYKMDMVTPGLVFVYGTGNDDDNTDGSEAMPNLSGGGDGSSGFGLTNLGFDGAHWTSTGGALLPGNNGNYGLWAVGLILKDFSLVENLSQTFTVVYGQGTNDSEGIEGYDVDSVYGLSDEDSFWEVNLNSDYALYENLTLWSELAYLNVDLDDDTWATTLGNMSSEEQSVAKLAVGIRYNF